MDVSSERQLSPGRMLALGLVRVGVGGLAVVLLAWPLGRGSWLLDLASHFAVLAALVGLPLSLLAFWLRRRGLLAVTVTLAVVSALRIAPQALPTRPVGVDGALTLLLANVHTQNRQHDRVASLIEAIDPDLVLLLEVDNRWLAALAPALVGHPHAREHPRGDNFGIALYSRVPLSSVRSTVVGGAEQIVAELPVAGRSCTLALVHAYPPMGPDAAAIHADQLGWAARARRRATRCFFLAGDLNSTPWSSRYRTLAADAELSGPPRAFGSATWPLPLPDLLRIPIDHVLASGPGRVSWLRLGPDVGSDHLPLLAELGVQP